MEVYPRAIWKEYKFQIFIVIATSTIVYLNSLGNGFVFDDNDQVLANPWIKDIKFLPQIFINSVWAFKPEYGGSNYYRPLMHVVYMLGYAISGLRPWGYHLISILFHVCSSVLVFLLARILLFDNATTSKGVSIPLVAAVIFAVHPIHTEAVAWVAGVPDLSYSFFSLFSLYLYIKSENRFNRYYFISVSAFFVGTLCKEPALTMVALFIAYDFLLNENKVGSSFLIKRYIPFILAASVYFGIRYFVLSGMVPARGGHSEYGLYDLFVILGTYLGLLLLPYKMQIIYSFRPIESLLEMRMLVALFVIASATALYYFWFRKDRLALFCLLSILIPLMPCFYISAINGPSLLAERYLYLPSVGYAVLLSMIISRVWNTKAAVAAAPAFLVLTVLFSAGTINRNLEWKDDYSLWSDTVKKSPENATAHDNLGSVYEKKGQYELAEAEFLAALKGYPIEVDAYKNLGITYKMMGMVDKSISAFSEFLKIKPDDADAHNDLGTVYIKKDDLKRAKEEFQTAVRLNPSKTIFKRNLEKVQQEMQG